MKNIASLMEFFGFLNRLQDSFREKTGREPTEESMKTNLGIHFDLSSNKAEKVVKEFLKKEEK